MRSGRPRRVPHGFTLLELMVSAVVGTVAIAGALALLTAQQHAFQSSAGDRAMQEAARSALADLSTNLRLAGYGIEPWLAFDFGPITNAPPSWTGAASMRTPGYPAGAPGSALPACSPAVAVTDRDSITGADEIVFHARSAAFNRQLSVAPTSTTLTFTRALTTPMYQGQILQVMCGGATQWAYVTVGAFADAGATQVSLAQGCTTGFPYQQQMLTSGCFSTGFANARVFKIDRFHYYVARFADEGGVARPYLMLDRGLKSNGAALVEPVAPDVEDLQIAYVFPRSAAATQLVGGASGTRLERSASSIDLDAVPPAYSETLSAASRATNHPGNIHGVRVSLVVRSASPDASLNAAGDATSPPAGNRAAIAADGGYRRIVVETTEAIRNMDVRGPYCPAYSVNNGADGLNVGGG